MLLTRALLTFPPVSMDLKKLELYTNSTFFKSSTCRIERGKNVMFTLSVILALSCVSIASYPPTHLNLLIILHTEEVDPFRVVHGHHSVGVDPLHTNR